MLPTSDNTPPAASGTSDLSENAADRAALDHLYQSARQAGEIEAVAYIGSVPEELQPLMDAFGRRFPGIRLNLQRMMATSCISASMPNSTAAAAPPIWYSAA